MIQRTANSPATHVVTYRGVRRECNMASYPAVCAALVEELGPATAEDYPRVTPIKAAEAPTDTGA